MYCRPLPSRAPRPKREQRSQPGQHAAAGGEHQPGAGQHHARAGVLGGSRRGLPVDAQPGKETPLRQGRFRRRPGRGCRRSSPTALALTSTGTPASATAAEITSVGSMRLSRRLCLNAPDHRFSPTLTPHRLTTASTPSQPGGIELAAVGIPVQLVVVGRCPAHDAQHPVVGGAQRRHQRRADQAGGTGYRNDEPLDRLAHGVKAPGRPRTPLLRAAA